MDELNVLEDNTHLILLLPAREVVGLFLLLLMIFVNVFDSCDSQAMPTCIESRYIYTPGAIGILYLGNNVDRDLNRHERSYWYLLCNLNI